MKMLTPLPAGTASILAVQLPIDCLENWTSIDEDPCLLSLSAGSTIVLEPTTLCSTPICSLTKLQPFGHEQGWDRIVKASRRLRRRIGRLDTYEGCGEDDVVEVEARVRQGQAPRVDRPRQHCKLHPLPSFLLRKGASQTPAVVLQHAHLEADDGARDAVLCRGIASWGWVGWSDWAGYEANGGGEGVGEVGGKCGFGRPGLLRPAPPLPLPPNRRTLHGHLHPCLCANTDLNRRELSHLELALVLVVDLRRQVAALHIRGAIAAKSTEEWSTQGVDVARWGDTEQRIFVRPASR